MKKQEMTENEEARVILARLEEEFHGRPMIADALMRGRKALESIRCLDPETGLMPCGCGGKVAIAKYPGFLDTPDLYQVDCFECFVGTKPTMSPERARIAWNKAMGYTDTLQGQ